MLVLIKLFLNLCLLKANPQDIPVSIFLKYAVLTVYILISFIVLLMTQPLGISFILVITYSVLLIGLAHISLTIRHFPERITQTVTALAGTDIILQLIATPLVSLQFDENNVTTVVPMFLLISLIVWNIVIIAHILKHALSIKFSLASAISLFYIYMSLHLQSFILLTPK